MNIQEIRQKYPQYSNVGDRELLTALHGKFYADMPINDFFSKVGFFQKGSAANQVLNDPITRGALNPAAGMSGGERFVAGAGKAVTEFGQGIAQALSEVNPMSAGPFAPVAGVVQGIASRLAPTRQEVVEQRDRDTPLMATPEGFMGNIAGTAATALPAGGAGSVPTAALAGATYGAAIPLGPGESRALNTAIGAGTSAGTQAVLGKLAASQTRPVPAETVKEQSFREGQKLGLGAPPSALGGGSFVGNRMESLAGKAALGQEFSKANQPMIDAVARRDAGLAPGQQITVKTLKDAREIMAKPYRDIAALSPTAASALDRLNQVRLDKNLAWNEFARNGSRQARSEAVQFQNTENMLESLIEQEAVKVGKMNAIPLLREARKNIAKNHTVQEALNKGSGEVDASIWGKMLDNEKPLSGDIEKVAKFQQAFKQYVKEGGLAPTPGVSALEPMAAAGFGIGGAAAAGPTGLLAGGIPLLRGPARSFLLSNMVQDALANPTPHLPGMVLSPRLRGILGPTLAGAYRE